MMHTQIYARTLPLPAAVQRLSELSYNLWFSWNDSAKALFARINPELWEQSLHNPVRLLKETDSSELERLAGDEAFLADYRRVLAQFDAYLASPTWFDAHFPQYKNQAIAYFSAEFGFHESLPIYSGGLGILAGDHCKSASDLGVPLTGIGLLYKKGYFNQKIDNHGGQQADIVSYDFAKLPILPAFAPQLSVDEQGELVTEPSALEELYVQVPVADRTVRLKIWQVRVGRNSVYLLDADLDENSPWDRELTGQLYGGNQDIRIAQEVLLGVGGVKTLRALGVPTGTYHINEGHAAFLSLERLREQTEKGLPFHVALEVIRASTVFTTHTPVPAGHDAFPLPMFQYYLHTLWQQVPDLQDTFTKLGLDEGKQLFNMTHLALNTSSLRNGVSKLHGKVSREMFREFHGDIDTGEVPIGHITNGVHLDTWLAPQFKELFHRFLPGAWSARQTNRDVWKAVDLIPPESLWGVHRELKEHLIRAARANLSEQRRRTGRPAQEIEEVQRYLSPKALTIGFARRFATYKRANLIFNNLERLDRLVNDPDRPVQFIFAGKAHPADHPGQEMIREIYRVSQLDRFRGKIILLENYDMNLARSLVQGVDIWLNNPRRPYEASGTSGQKAALNGVINFSVLDGWWEEGYDGSNGWSIDSNFEADWQTQERENTESIYGVLEREIVPLYYNQGELPLQWIERMKRSICTLTPVYNTDRMVMDYTGTAYVPSLQRTQHFVADNYVEAAKVADYKQFIRQHWHEVRVIEVNDQPGQTQPGGGLKEITATIKFGTIWYRDTAVELIYYEERPDGWEQIITPMEPSRNFDESTVLYRALVPPHLRHSSHFSIRVLPVSDNFARRFELPLVTTF